jgi:hypothetical protein
MVVPETAGGTLERHRRSGKRRLEGFACVVSSAGRLARIVKLADLGDHLAHATLPSDAPTYAWARKHLLATANGVTCRRSVG